MAPSPMMAIKNGGSIQEIPNSKEGYQAYLQAEIINSKTESQRCLIKAEYYRSLNRANNSRQRCLIKAEYYRSLNRANNSRVDDMQRCLDQLESVNSVPGKPKKSTCSMKIEKKNWKPTGYTVFMKASRKAFNVAGKEWNELNVKAKGVSFI